MTIETGRRALVLAAFLAAAATGAAAQEPQAPIPGSIPPRALIAGVPYVSWHEAAVQDYPHRDIGNPSIQAASVMVAWYWDDALTSAEDAAARLKDEPSPQADFEELPVATFEDLKAAVARGVPVNVALTLTPDAHTFYVVYAMMSVFYDGSVPQPPEGRCSGALFRMFPLEMVAPWKVKMRKAMARNQPAGQAEADEHWPNPVLDSAIAAHRVLVGYDDERKVAVVHDPSFGPAVEIPYADFERMWAAQERLAWAGAPPDADAHVARRATAAIPYRERTAAEQAAETFVRGYALTAIGRPREAVPWFDRGLALAGLPDGYRHLLLLEKAYALASMGQVGEAIGLAQEAASLVPDASRPWELLSELYRSSSLEGRRKLAKDAASRAAALAGDPAARRRLAEAIPSDFHVQYLGRIRGWAAPLPKQAAAPAPVASET